MVAHYHTRSAATAHAAVLLAATPSALALGRAPAHACVYCTHALRSHRVCPVRSPSCARLGTAVCVHPEFHCIANVPAKLRVGGLVVEIIGESAHTRRERGGIAYKLVAFAVAVVRNNAIYNGRDGRGQGQGCCQGGGMMEVRQRQCSRQRISTSDRNVLSSSMDSCGRTHQRD